MGTKIEWADEVLNVVTGCTPVSAGCQNCYARRMHGRFSKEPFSEVKFHPERLDQPLRWLNPRRIFVCSMGDLFHEDVPDEFISRVFGRMRCANQHTFMILTKRPERMRWFIWNLPNVWLGVSVENQSTADERIPMLLKTPAAVRFVSVEPMLGPVDLLSIKTSDGDGPSRELIWIGEGAGIGWVICGAETGPGARPMDPTWARDLRDQCREAHVRFFMKQMSGRALIPDDLMIREFPEAKA